MAEQRDKNGDTFEDFLKKTEGGNFDDLMEELAVALYGAAIGQLAKDMGVGRDSARKTFEHLLKLFDELDSKDGVKVAAEKSGSFVVAGPTTAQ